MSPDPRSVLLPLALSTLALVSVAAPQRGFTDCWGTNPPDKKVAAGAVVRLPADVVRVSMMWGEHGRAAELTLRLKPLAELRRILAGLKQPDLFDELACQPRCDVAPEALEAALATARRTLDTVSADTALAPGLDGADRHELWNAFMLASRIVITWGEAADVDRLLASKPGENPWAIGRRLKAAALLEARLGRLENGSVAARLTSKDPEVAVLAAVLLDELGSRRGEPVLFAALKEPTPLHLSAYAARALLDRKDASTLAAMRAFLERLQSPGTSFESWSAVPQNPWVSAVAYLLAYGDAADRARAMEATWGARHAELFAWLVEDPAPLLVGIANSSGFESAAIGAQALRALPPRRAAAVEASVRDALQEYGARVRPQGDQYSPEDQGAYQVDSYDLMRSYERPVQLAGELALKQSIFMSPAPWIATPWLREKALDALVAGTIVPGGREQLDYLTQAELATGLAARKAAEKLLDAEALLAWHSVASRAFTAQFDAVTDGVARRPYVLVHNGDDQGAISGVLHQRTTIEGKRLRVELALGQSAYYHVGSLIDFNGGVRENWDHHRYVKDGGKALIASVSARRGKRAFAGVAQPVDGAAGTSSAQPFVYVLELDDASLSDLWLEVRFRFFEQRHDFVFPLWHAHFAPAAQSAPSRPVEPSAARSEPQSDADGIALGKALEDAGDLEGAWLTYRLVLADRPWDRALWYRAADMFAKKGDHARAADVLWAMLQYNGADADVWSDLGTQHWLAGDYDAAGEAWRSSLIADPSQEETKVWWSVALYLDDRAADALIVLESFQPHWQPARIVALRYIVSQRLASGVEGARKALADLTGSLPAFASELDIARMLLQPQPTDDVDAGSGVDSDRARARCYAGYANLFAGDHDVARSEFQKAVTAGAPGDFAVRLARHEIARLDQGR